MSKPSSFMQYKATSLYAKFRKKNEHEIAIIFESIGLNMFWEKKGVSFRPHQINL